MVRICGGKHPTYLTVNLLSMLNAPPLPLTFLLADYLLFVTCSTACSIVVARQLHRVHPSYSGGLRYRQNRTARGVESAHDSSRRAHQQAYPHQETGTPQPYERACVGVSCVSWGKRLGHVATCIAQIFCKECSMWNVSLLHPRSTAHNHEDKGRQNWKNFAPSCLTQCTILSNKYWVRLASTFERIRHVRV